MNILTDECTPFSGKTAVILGNFDGFHLAHRRLCKEMTAYAKEHDLIPAAFCLMNPPSKGALLTTHEEKCALLRENGVEVLFCREFQQIRDLSPEKFTEEILLNSLNAQALFCGYNYRFGKGRAADAQTLKQLCKGRAEVFVLDAVLDENQEPISSTLIRNLYAKGDLAGAERRLGRPLKESH